MIHIKYRS